MKTTTKNKNETIVFKNYRFLVETVFKKFVDLLTISF